MLNSTPLPYQADASVYFRLIRGLPWAAWLDSAGCGRYDILVAQPVTTLTTRGSETEIKDASGTRHSQEDPFALVREYTGSPVVPIPGIPFAGGALGYWGYDLGRRYYRLSGKAVDDEHLPQMAVGIYDWAIVLDHQELTARLLSRQRHAETAQRLRQLGEMLAAGALFRKTPENTPFRVHGNITTNMGAPDYSKAFKDVMRYLHDGDCYQVNLARRYTAQATGDALQAYLELRRLSPAPYSAFLDWPQIQVLSASPERFLHALQGTVESNPIKGTRVRSMNAAEDARLAEDLRQHAKDRAENLMIVDLLRNDLGKNCETGSVSATKLFEVQSFANVHHLVSTVTGKIRNGNDAFDVLRDCFPGGSITGAPKLRAMEIIEQLEPQRRGIYCGSIGYIGCDGNMDTNIVIRTLVYSQGSIRCGAGGGLVADSQCEAEYQETCDKAAALLNLLQRFGGSVVNA